MSDGCTAGPLSDLLNSFAYQCCVIHDQEYAAVLTPADKAMADWHLFTCTLGTGHVAWAIVMLLAVTLFGWLFIKRR